MQLIISALRREMTSLRAVVILCAADMKKGEPVAAQQMSMRLLVKTVMTKSQMKKIEKASGSNQIRMSLVSLKTFFRRCRG